MRLRVSRFIKAKGMFSRSSAALSCLALSVLLLYSGKAAATSILYQFNTPFPSDPNPAGSAPWVTAVFQDVSPGTVALTITAVNFTAGEFIAGNGNGASGGMFFNLNPSDNPTALMFTEQSSKGNFGTAKVSTGENSFKAGGDGKYDIQIDFSGMFSANDSITFLITGVAGLNGSDFSYLSQPAGGSGPFYAAAHIQGLANGDSTWIEPGAGPLPVPEPSTWSLLAASIGVWGFWRWHQRTKIQTN